MATEEHVHSGGCCGGGQGGHSHDNYDALDMAHDPTLMSCCEKDAIAFDRAMELKKFLTDHDPTTQNVRLRQQIILPPPENEAITTSAKAQAQAQAAAAASSMDERLKELDIESEDSDLDFDDDFDDLLASRRQELAKQFEQAAKNAAEGYGIILDTSFPSLMGELKATPEVPRVVFVHPTGADAAGVQAMLKEMLVVANRFLGTKFYSLQTNAADSGMLRELRLSTEPAFVAFCQGQRVDAASIQPKELTSSVVSTLWEAKLLSWLTMCHVLEATRQDKRRPHAGPTRASALKKPDVDELAFDCGVAGCRIRFAYDHEHVGPSQESKRKISAWRSTAEA